MSPPVVVYFSAIPLSRMTKRFSALLVFSACGEQSGPPVTATSSSMNHDLVVGDSVLAVHEGRDARMRRSQPTYTSRPITSSRMTSTFTPRWLGIQQGLSDGGRSKRVGLDENRLLCVVQFLTTASVQPPLGEKRSSDGKAVGQGARNRSCWR